MRKMIVNMLEEDERKFIEKLLELDAEIRATVKFMREKIATHRKNPMPRFAENRTD